MILYTLVEVNVTRPLHKMRGESQRWCEESQRIFNELGDTFWEGRAALMPLGPCVFGDWGRVFDLQSSHQRDLATLWQST